MRETHGYQIKYEAHEDAGVIGMYFDHEGHRYYAPGRPALPESGDDDLLTANDWLTPLQGASGPDSAGEDPRIKTPEQLVDCLTDVVERLTSLEEFEWGTSTMPMSPGVFEALSKLTTLSSLHLTLSTLQPRWQVHECE